MAANRASSAQAPAIQLNPEVASLLARLDPEHPAVRLAFQDHTEEPVRGICINEWLRHKGYLFLRNEPEAPGTPIEKCDIDWSRTLAWAEGGRFARVYLNVKGRQPQGIVESGAYERIRQDLCRKLAQIPDDDGRPMQSMIHRPDLTCIEGDTPDLITVFENMRWHAIGSLGWNALHIFEDDWPSYPIDEEELDDTITNSDQNT